MATLKELRDERVRKLADIKKLGLDPYPGSVKRSQPLSSIISNFDQLNGQTMSVTGRVVNIRRLGKISFIVIRDQSDELQLFISNDKLAGLDKLKNLLGYDQIPLLDGGDFIEATGQIIKTKTGEISIDLSELKLLTKALRPMPEKHTGFTNKEERLRRRYIDINVNKDVKERFIRRSKFWQTTRQYLNDHGFLEINIPVLEHTTGGADANPFVTHMDALDQDFYLRISHELPLKRLIGAGYEKVYDIGPRFRNENYSEEHLPEHIAMEWYWAYADWYDGMKFMEDMFKKVAEQAFGRLKFKVGELEFDFGSKWQQIDYSSVLKEHYQIDVISASLDEIKAQLKKHKLEVEQTENRVRGIDKLWKNVRRTIAGPAWLINTPLFISPLAKARQDNPNVTDRFQAIIGGSELGNGWSELNDPVEQLRRFQEQQQLRDQGDNEAMMLDIDYVEMLEYGMPPTCGWGHSERLFWLLEGVSAREGVPFPQLKTEIDNVTKSIYPDLKF